MKTIDVTGLDYVCIRTYSAGVHFGYLKSKQSARDGYYEVTLLKSRRLWSWAGANSLTDLVMKGSSKPNECKFTIEVNEIDLMAIEIIKVPTEGKDALDKIPFWTFS
jgi:hypothetical protein